MALYHLGLTVSDLGRSVRFYRDVVGMSEDDQSVNLGMDRDQGDTGGQTTVQTDAGDAIATRSDAFDRLTNNPGSELRAAFLQMDGFCLQLVQYVAGGGEVLDLRHNRIGTPHMSFYVDDVEAKFTEVQAHGDVTITSDIVQIVPTMRSFYVSDPDGVPIEFLQLTI
jgi:catechol 2,3-dioxygenase-like lactoylglutathione lyase family enzyme